MKDALLFVPFAVFGLFPLATQVVAIVLHRSERLERVQKRASRLRRLFPLFICFDLFAQNRERAAVAYRWGYNLKKDGVIVQTGEVPDSSEVSPFLEFEAFGNPAVVESIASFLVNAVDTPHDFDAFELTLRSKERPPVPRSVTDWFAHDAFVRAPFRERVVLTYELDS